jgi:hypothetical protein
MLRCFDDGSARLEWNGPQGDLRQINLRRPLLGHGRLLEMELTGLIGKQQEELRELARLASEPAEGEEERTALTATEINERFQTFQAESVAAWWRLCIEGNERWAGLGDAKLPDDIEEWPYELLVSPAARELLQHFQSLPLARGAQPPELIQALKIQL